MKKMSVDDKLALDLFHTDEEESHIKVDLEYGDEAEIRKLLLACPAECYKWIDREQTFSHLGCLECGTCRILSHGKVVQEWRHPQSGAGVSFRQG